MTTSTSSTNDDERERRMFTHRGPSATAGRLTEDQRVRLRDLETSRGPLSQQQRGEVRALLRSSADPGETARARRLLDQQQARDESVRQVVRDTLDGGGR